MTWIQSPGVGAGARRNAALALVGAATLTVAPVAWNVVPLYRDAVVVVPILLGFGVLEVHARYGAVYGALGRAGTLLLGIGLALTFVAALLNAVLPDAFVKLFVVALPGLSGLAVLAVGSVLIGYRLGQLGDVPRSGLLTFALALPVGPLVGIVVAAAARSFAPVVAPLAGSPLGLGLYGLGWASLAVHLLRTADVDPAGPTDDAPIARPGGPSPQVVVAALAGAALVVLGASRLLPAGPFAASRGVGGLAFDLVLVGVGSTGLVLAAGRDPRRARGYNRAAGAFSLAVVALGAVALLGGPGPLATLAGALRLTVVGLIPFVATGAVLAAVGFGVDEAISGTGTSPNSPAGETRQ